jgi:hypothetical protein
VLSLLLLLFSLSTLLLLLSLSNSSRWPALLWASLPSSFSRPCRQNPGRRGGKGKKKQEEGKAKLRVVVVVVKQKEQGA